MKNTNKGEKFFWNTFKQVVVKFIKFFYYETHLLLLS